MPEKLLMDLEKLIDDIELKKESVYEGNSELLSISKYILSKESIIKKEHPDIIHFNYKKNQSFEKELISLGTYLKRVYPNILIENKKVSVLLEDCTLDTMKKQQIEDSVYCVHKLRDWLGHGHYEKKNGYLEIFPPDASIKSFSITQEQLDNFSDTIINYQDLDYVLHKLYYNEKTHTPVLIQLIKTEEPTKDVLMKKNDIGNHLLEHRHGLWATDEEYKISSKIGDIQVINEYKSKPNTMVPILDRIAYKMDAKEISSEEEKIVEQFYETYKKDRKSLIQLMKQIGIDLESSKQEEYLYAAIYAYVNIVFSKLSVSSLPTTQIDLSSLEATKIDNETVSDLNKSIESSLEKGNNKYSIYHNLIIQKHPKVKEEVMIEKEVSSCEKCFEEIIEKLGAEKREIIRMIRNSIEHGNYTIKNKKIELVDKENNNIEIEENNKFVGQINPKDFYLIIKNCLHNTYPKYTIMSQFKELSSRKDISSTSVEIYKKNTIEAIESYLNILVDDEFLSKVDYKDIHRMKQMLSNSISSTMGKTR